MEQVILWLTPVRQQTAYDPRGGDWRRKYLALKVAIIPVKALISLVENDAK